MGKMFLCLTLLASAFVWFSYACGFIVPSAWQITLAFAAVGVWMVITALKELVS